MGGRLSLGLLFCLAMSSALEAQPAARVDARLARLQKLVELTRDISYADTDDPRQTLDLLLPRKRKAEQLPVIVYIHGGGWRHGSKDKGIGPLAKQVISGEYGGVSIGYRLSGTATWPAQIHDCKAAIRWIRAHAEEYGLDADRIGVMGTSAGGHLSALLGTSGDVDEISGHVGAFADQSSRVACVVDFYGPIDLLRMNELAPPDSRVDHDAPNSAESQLMGGKIQEHPELAKTANPLTYVSTDDPPFLIVHGTRDPLVGIGQSELLHQALRKAGIESTLITVNGGLHGKNFGPKTNQLAYAFFAHHLLGRKTNWEDRTVDAVSR